jgi:hypothetical protein
MSGAERRKPGYPLVSFLPLAKKDTASIPCACQNPASCRILASEFAYGKLHLSALADSNGNSGIHAAFPAVLQL